MATDPSTDSPAWHTLAATAVLEEVGSRERGLTDSEVAERQSKYGPNELPQPAPPSALLIFVRQFKSPLIYVLAVAAVVALAIGEYTDAGFIVVVLVSDAIIGAFQEYHAEQSIQALQELLRVRATVVRDGAAVEVDSTEVVPGDVVILEPGNRVPADTRLLNASGLEIDESTLTGESTPVTKEAEWTGDEATPVADRLNMAFAGSTVTRGRGRAVVVATGSDTVVGQLAQDVMAIEGGEPPLVHRMEEFTRTIGLAVLVLAILSIAIGVGFREYSFFEMFLFAVALMVAAIPEGLPVSITVALGVATRRMTRVGVLVRRMVAVEGLGSCTFIATDKTGTLTENELTVRRVQLADGATYDVTGQGYEPEGEVVGVADAPDPEGDPALGRAARAAVLCNEATLQQRDGEWTWRGDPTDVALLAFGRKLAWDRESALDRYEPVTTIPFEPERRFAASYNRDREGTDWVFVKGAPERVFELCAWPAADGVDRDEAQRMASALARDGYRLLALAEATLDTPVDPADPPSEPSGLALIGFVGMIDPLRVGADRAIATARSAGIDVCMVTGDHPETALAIAQDLGLATDPEEVMTGRELASLEGEARARAIRETRVFARVSPDQKLKIVEAVQRTGHFVAVTGDGVNDAPALHTANIGIAMGESGTDVARDSSELVLSDDNFSTIVSGIEQGRIAYDNIRKVIYMLISTNASEIVLVLLSLLAGLPLPLLPVQLLWLNLVTEGGQDIALGFEPAEGNVLDRPPRDPDEPIFDRLMIERTALAAVVMGVVGFLTFKWFLDTGQSVEMARNGLLLLMVLFENVHVGNSRSETRSLFSLSPFSNPILLASAVVALGMHVGALYLGPLQAILDTAPVAPGLWVELLGLALILAVVMELHKVSWRVRTAPQVGGSGD